MCVRVCVCVHVCVCSCMRPSVGMSVFVSGFPYSAANFTSPMSRLPDKCYCVHFKVIISFCVSIMCLCLDSRTLLT